MSECSLNTLRIRHWLNRPKFRHIKSSLYSRYYAEACNERRIHLRGLASGQHSSEETSQWLQAVRDICLRFDWAGNRSSDLPHRCLCPLRQRPVVQSNFPFFAKQLNFEQFLTSFWCHFLYFYPILTKLIYVGGSI